MSSHSRHQHHLPNGYPSSFSCLHDTRMSCSELPSGLRCVSHASPLLPLTARVDFDSDDTSNTQPQPPEIVVFVAGFDTAASSFLPGNLLAMPAPAGFSQMTLVGSTTFQNNNTTTVERRVICAGLAGCPSFRQRMAVLAVPRLSTISSNLSSSEVDVLWLSCRGLEVGIAPVNPVGTVASDQKLTSPEVN